MTPAAALVATIDRIEKRIEQEMFPETTRLAWRRKLHWRECDFAQHYRSRAKMCGVFTMAQNMRKQGFLIETTLSVLTGREK